MNSWQTFLVIVFLGFAVSFFPPVLAVQPAWTYSVTNESAISAMAVSSDGSTIIVAADTLWIFSKDGILLKKEKYGNNVVVTPSGRFAASSLGGTVYFFNTPLTTGPSDPSKIARFWEYEFPNPVRSIDITDDGSTVVAATEGRAIHILRPISKEVISSDDFYNAVIRISHDGGRIVGISADNVRLYSKSAKVSRKFVMHNISSDYHSFVLLSQTVPLMVFDDSQWIRSYDLSMGSELWHARVTGNLNSLTMTPSGSFVVTATDWGNITRYDDKGELNWTYSYKREDFYTAGMNKVAISKDGGLVAAITNQGDVLLLNEKGKLVGSYHVTADQIRYIAMSQDGSILLVASDQNIYAFLTGYTASARPSSPSLSRSPAAGSLNTSLNNISAPQNLTRRPVLPTWTKPFVSETITELPTEYSIIRTPTKSPLDPTSGILALVTIIILYIFRKN